MASTTIGSSGVTFPDATTQSTAPVNTNANVTSATAVAGTGISVTSVTTTGAATHTITNTGVTSVTGAGTVSVSGSTGAITITGTGGSGTVTSVATGNGLSGGTITTSGTLSITAPSWGSVGSYQALGATTGDSRSPNANYSGTACYSTGANACGWYTGSQMSGTWRCQGVTANNPLQWIGVRIS